jgi:hypothetical protein
MLKNIIQGVIDSFNNKQNEGMSARKLTAFLFSLLIIYIHVKFIDITNVIDALLIDSGTLLLLLGIITMEQIIKFKNGDKEQ